MTLQTFQSCSWRPVWICFMLISSCLRALFYFSYLLSQSPLVVLSLSRLTFYRLYFSISYLAYCDYYCADWIFLLRLVIYQRMCTIQSALERLARSSMVQRFLSQLVSFWSQFSMSFFYSMTWLRNGMDLSSSVQRSLRDFSSCLFLVADWVSSSLRDFSSFQYLSIQSFWLTEDWLRAMRSLVRSWTQCLSLEMVSWAQLSLALSSQCQFLRRSSSSFCEEVSWRPTTQSLSSQSCSSQVERVYLSWWFFQLSYWLWCLRERLFSLSSQLTCLKCSFSSEICLSELEISCSCEWLSASFCSQLEITFVVRDYILESSYLRVVFYLERERVFYLCWWSYLAVFFQFYCCQCSSRSTIVQSE